MKNNLLPCEHCGQGIEKIYKESTIRNYIDQLITKINFELDKTKYREEQMYLYKKIESYSKIIAELLLPIDLWPDNWPTKKD